MAPGAIGSALDDLDLWLRPSAANSHWPLSNYTEITLFQHFTRTLSCFVYSTHDSPNSFCLIVGSLTSVTDKDISQSQYRSVPRFAHLCLMQSSPYRLDT